MPLNGSSPPPTLHPCISTCAIGYTKKWQAFPAAIHSKVQKLVHRYSLKELHVSICFPSQDTVLICISKYLRLCVEACVFLKSSQIIL